MDLERDYVFRVVFLLSNVENFSSEIEYLIKYSENCSFFTTNFFFFIAFFLKIL